MNERKNLIVTCGTSQIQAGKYQKADLADRDAFFEFIKSFSANQWDETAPDESFFKSNEVKGWPEKFARPCVKHWDKRFDLLGTRENILGAEISTLVAMEKEGAEYSWDPKTDYFHLIASHSKSGLFAAKVAETILVTGWGVEIKRIKIDMVPGLNQNTPDPDQAMYNLAKVIGEVLQEDKLDDPWQNLFVSSGGFKSTLPLLTLYSFLFGIPLVNTYEFSSHLQRLSPRVNMKDKASSTFWHQTWERLSQQKFMEGDTSRYLQYTMDYRVNKAKHANF